MERLTIKNPHKKQEMIVPALTNGEITCTCKALCLDMRELYIGDDSCTHCDIQKAFTLLAAYEDTGLAPEEVRTLISNAEKSVFTIKTEIAEKAKAYDKVSAENTKLRELLTSAVKDFESVANNVAYDGFVCGEECAHFSKCDIFKNDDDRIYRCQKFKWQYANEAEEVLKND